MSALTDLQAAYQAEIDEIADQLAKARASMLLERLVSAYESQAKLEARDIQSYTIAGRSVTYRTLDTGKTMIAELETSLMRSIRGSTYRVNMGGYPRAY